MYVKELFKRKILGEGQMLLGPTAQLNCFVLADGKIELSNYPTPFQTILDATRCAESMIQYGGFHFAPKSMRTPNPLHYWKYLDEFSNREEKLSRLWSLSKSSYVEPSEFCFICFRSTLHQMDEVVQDDAATFFAEQHYHVVAPRRHFADIRNIPARDASAMFKIINREVAKVLSSSSGVRVAGGANEAGHVYYSIETDA